MSALCRLLEVSAYCLELTVLQSAQVSFTSFTLTLDLHGYNTRHLPNSDSISTPPIEDVTFNGDAQSCGKRISLTRALSDQKGSAFFPIPFFNEAFTFQAKYLMSTGNSPTDCTGCRADGFTIVLHSDASGPNAIGNDGGGNLGIYSGSYPYLTSDIYPAVIMEVDRCELTLHLYFSIENTSHY